METITKKFGILTSSVDPNKLATTVQGFILGASAFIIFTLHKAGIEIGSDQITVFAYQIGTVISSLMILFGAIRKIVLLVHDILHQANIENIGSHMEPMDRE